MLTKLRSAVGITLIWLATVAGVSVTAWVAIDRAGRDISGTSVSSFANPSLGTAGDTPTTASTQPPATSDPQTSSSAVPPAAPRDRSANVAGGQVSVRCTGDTIRLRIAQPDNGWRVDVDKPGPKEVRLHFERGSEEAERETKVTAVCTDGTPTFTVSDDE